MGKNKICLAMIVKNEEQDIQRCLDSVKDHIDYWVISDTGSEDNTKQLIQEIMDGHGIPGELHDHNWKDFSTNN
jgi:glycosyltransferase involved in cell wall biosynthesis